MPSSPFAARTDAAVEQAALANVIAQVEARLREDPEQGKGWEAIAPVYLKLGRFRDAANAYANAARLNGETVPLLAGRAESAMLASDGVVTEEARVAYEKILQARAGARGAPLLAGDGQGAGRQARRRARRLQSSAGGGCGRCILSSAADRCASRR